MSTDPAAAEPGTRAPRPRRIVLTGGPGGGKTAVFEAVRARFGHRLTFVPEAATIVLGGGFPRRATREGRMTAQLAIYRVQEQLERLLESEASSGITVLDRSLVDAMVYWPDEPDAMLPALGTTREALFARYDHVLHLEVPRAGRGYDLSNPVRVETAAEAAELDARIAEVWRGHPGVVHIASTARFEEKIAHCLASVDAFVAETRSSRADGVHIVGGES